MQKAIEKGNWITICMVILLLIITGCQSSERPLTPREIESLAYQGDPGAQYHLGYLYYVGSGFPQNYMKAHIWHNIAAANGNGRARANLANIAKQLSPDKLTEAQNIADSMIKENPALMNY